MFLDGPRNKGNLIINHVSLWACKDEEDGRVGASEIGHGKRDNTGGSSTNKRSTTDVILSKIGNKLGANQLKKDLPLGLFAPTSNAATNDGLSRQQQRFNKSFATKLSLIGKSHSIVRNSSRGPRNRGNSLAVGSQRVSATKGPLRRTSSLHTSAGAREKSSFVKLHHADQELQQASVVKLLEANKRLRCAISNRVTKLDAWLSSHLSLVFILVNLFLLLAAPTSSFGAPVPRAVLQPIWMNDGLISMDSLYSSQANEEPPLAEEPPAAPNDRWLVQLKVVDPEDLDLADLDQAQPPTPGLSEASEANLNELNEANEDDNLLPVQFDEQQVRLERRRLDRNRALEPPPWLRMQPMRRDGASVSGFSDQQESVESGSQRQVQYDEADGEQRAPRGRQSRESTERAYQELIGQLLDQTMGNGPLLGDLYDELELRYQVSNGGGDPKPIAASNKLSGSGLEVGPTGASGQSPDQVNSNDATLVIVGDEVSSGDDGAPLVSANPSNTVVTTSSNLLRDPQRLANEPSLVDEAAIETGGVRPSSSTNNIKSAAYMVQPLVEPQLAGLRLVSLGDQQEQQQQQMMTGGQASGYLQLNPSAQAQTSFHVVEDIDQADSGQDMRPALQQQQQQQQQQTISFVDTGDIGEPSSASALDSLYQSKRSYQPSFGRMTRGPPVSRWQNSDIDAGGNNREQLAIMMIEGGLFSQSQLIEAANRLREHLEGVIGLSEGTIIGLYPMGDRDLLIKLDTANLNNLQRTNLIKNYNFARGYIVKSWPHGSQQSPVPLLAAILRNLARNGSLTKLNSNIQLAQVMLPVDSYDDAELEESLRAKLGPYQLLQQQRQDQALAGGYLWPIGDFHSTKSMATILSNLAALEQPAPLASGGSQAPPEAGKWPHLESGYVQLTALLAALLIALLMVKLVTRPDRSRGAQLKRRLCTLWSTTSGQEEVAQASGGVSGEAKGLEAGDQPPPPPAYMSARDYSAKQFGVLSQRLAQLISRQSSAGPDLESAGAEQRREPSKSQELDEASASDLNQDEQNQATPGDENNLDNPGGSGRFRSSRSYIRSLIEALTKSKVAQVVTQQTISREQQVDGDELEAAAAKQQVAAADSLNVVSQMDISAAHLILDYMEKHLEDKERLRREWLELNAGGQQHQSKAEPAKTSRASQATLHKLAKVGLSEENKAKNRNSQVVPLDRNRVRLGIKHGNGASSDSDAAPRGASRQQDYINASYIYDDDLRRPTHIIAQGPLDEQAAGHFWQMIWEQGVSVVVALTRLNENSIRMCHRYWPTTTAAGAKLDHLAKDDTVSGPRGVVSSTAAPLDSPNGDSNGRRSSVTSVLNGNGAGGANAGGSHQPIVAPNGDNQNNIVCFQVHSGPNNEALKLEVHLVSEHVSSQDYLVRNMYLVNRSSGETRTITQFHYLAWPESGVPTNVRSFLEFRRKVHKSYRNLSSPILVHCSDGGGRSGTYTLIDIILERIRNGAKEIDPRATLEHLRDQRAGLCASQAQFEFVLMALAEEIQIILNALPH